MSVVGSGFVLIIILLIGGGLLAVSSILQFLLARKHRALGLILPLIDLLAIPLTGLVLRLMTGIGFGRASLVGCIFWLIPLIVHLIIYALCRSSARKSTRAEEERRKRELDQMQIQDL